MADYLRRVVDAELDELLVGLPAISLEGPKGVGKTATATRRSGTEHRLDEPGVLEVLRADPSLVVTGRPPVLIDEWQRLPVVWDVIRRAVDDGPTPGRFLLTGSATPGSPSTHSGAGRIVTLRMRPLAFSERGIAQPTVSLTQLLSGRRPSLEGRTDIRLTDYVDEIVAGGFPGMRGLPDRAARAALDGYLARVVDRDIPDAGVEVRRPATLRRWLTAYAAATATTASWERIRAAATAGEDEKPARSTTIPYREALERVWMLDPVEAWHPSRSPLRRLGVAPRHHLADPALAARLLGVGREALLHGAGERPSARDGVLLGALFESLATLSIRVLAQAAEARTAHLRLHSGQREIDLILERADGGVVAIEVKLASAVDDADVRHLLWLRDELGDRLLDAVVVTTGTTAYRRSDGVGVVPLALLGP
jgi:predicted AAA+ superfamily ATPase